MFKTTQKRNGIPFPYRTGCDTALPNAELLDRFRASWQHLLLKRPTLSDVTYVLIKLDSSSGCCLAVDSASDPSSRDSLERVALERWKSRVAFEQSGPIPSTLFAHLRTKQHICRRVVAQEAVCSVALLPPSSPPPSGCLTERDRMRTS